MVTLRIRNVKGKQYAYLEKTVRINNAVRKIYRYLGPEKEVSQKMIKAEKERFEETMTQNAAKLRARLMAKKITRFEYPLSLQEMQKIEQMNEEYHQILKRLHPKNVDDLFKRFIANYVFETNALEGNSLTLKNVAEIVFENRISQGKDLREVYDAQNSYRAFLFLQKTRKEIHHEFIIKIHSMLMERIDDRIGYRTVPVILIGNPRAPLSPPERVQKEMNALVQWYTENKERIYPLELAFKFHAQFEKIHPFCDGNGRTGRLLLNYILMKKGYFPVIIRNTNRNRYIQVLAAADRKKWIPLMYFALEHYKDTFRKFFAVYYRYAKL